MESIFCDTVLNSTDDDNDDDDDDDDDESRDRFLLLNIGSVGRRALKNPSLSLTLDTGKESQISHDYSVM